MASRNRSDSRASLEFDLKVQLGKGCWKAQGQLPLTGVTAVFGPSGSGKTTFLRCLAGLEKKRCRGQLSMGETVWQDDAQGCFVPPESRGIGYVFQEGLILPWRTVFENLQYAWQRAPASRRRGTINEVVDRIGISHLLDRSARNLSGGEKQRVAIARALLSFPQVLLMDEPLASLDEEGKLQLLAALAEWRRRFEIPILYVTHHVSEVARFADRVFRFDAGAARGLISVAELLSEKENYAEGGQEIISRLELTPRGYDATHRIAEFSLGEDSVFVPSNRLPSAGSVRLLIRARDLSLTLERVVKTSILNSIAVVVVGHEQMDSSTVLVRCKHATGTILVALTTLAFEKLEIVEGLRCRAQFKASALQLDGAQD